MLWTYSGMKWKPNNTLLKTAVYYFWILKEIFSKTYMRLIKLMLSISVHLHKKQLIILSFKGYLLIYSHTTQLTECSFPNQGSNLGAWQWKRWVLTTGPPRKSSRVIFKSETMTRRAFASFFSFRDPRILHFQQRPPSAQVPQGTWSLAPLWETWAKGEKEKLIFSHNLLLFPPL